MERRRAHESKIIELKGYKVDSNWQWRDEEINFILEQLTPASTGTVLTNLKIQANAKVFRKDGKPFKLRKMNDKEIREFKFMNSEKLKELKPKKLW